MNEAVSNLRVEYGGAHGHILVQFSDGPFQRSDDARVRIATRLAIERLASVLSEFEFFREELEQSERRNRKGEV